MELRKLGRSQLEVSKLCFGGNVFGWTADEKESFRLLDTFVDLGFNFIDTADVYSVWVEGNKGGESETILGKWLKNSGKRKDIVLATKVGAELGPSQKGLSKEYIRKAVEASLQRLQTDYIDLYQSHYDDQSLPVTEPLEVYSQLIAEGKVRFAGASNFSPERLQEALEASDRGLPRYESLQPLYNLVERGTFEKEFEPLTTKYDLGVISYYSLASGFLTGKYRTEADLNKSPRGGGVKKYLNEGGLNVLSALDQLAEKYQATPAQISLAWLTAQKAVTSAIVSATSTGQLEDIAGSVSLELDETDLSLLNEASA